MRRLFMILGFIFLIVGGYLLYTSYINTPDESVDVTIGQPTGQELTTDSVVGVGQGADNGDRGPAVAAASSLEPEIRVVEFEWPTEFRSGESGSVRVKLRPFGEDGLVAEAQIADNAIQTTPIAFANCYDTHEAKVTAYMRANEFDVQDEFSNATRILHRDQAVEWLWTLTPEEDGSLVFTVRLDVEWTLLPGQADTFSCSTTPPTTFWTQAVQVEVSKVFGLLTIPHASMLGSVLAVLGFIGEIPLMGELIAVIFERRLERGDERRRERRDRRRNRRR